MSKAILLSTSCPEKSWTHFIEVIKSSGWTKNNQTKALGACFGMVKLISWRTWTSMHSSWEWSYYFMQMHALYVLVYIIRMWDPTGAGECGGQEIDGVQQREGVHPQCGGEHGQGVQEAVPDRPGQLPPSKIKGDEERWLHVPCLPRQDLRRPHRPGWSWHSLRDPLSGCLGWSSPRGTSFFS